MRAVTSARRVKVAGSGHSFTDIACTDGVMLDLSRMRRLLAVNGNEVTVEAGITIRELGPALAERGLALENQGDVDAQTLAGAICTATHGTGARLGNLATQVEEWERSSGAVNRVPAPATSKHRDVRTDTPSRPLPGRACIRNECNVSGSFVRSRCVCWQASPWPARSP